MTQKNKEVRSLSFELRNIDSEKRTVEGVVNSYGSAADFGAFKEVVRAGAFTKSLEGGDQLALYNHDSGRLLGRVSSGTLTLEDSEEGLRFKLALPNTSDGNDVFELMQRGDLKSMSFGFYVESEKWNDDFSVRELIELNLVEVSIVAMPAYTDTQAALRSKDAATNEHKQTKIRQLKMRLSVAQRKSKMKGRM